MFFHCFQFLLISTPVCILLNCNHRLTFLPASLPGPRTVLAHSWNIRNIHCMNEQIHEWKPLSHAKTKVQAETGQENEKMDSMANFSRQS